MTKLDDDLQKLAKFWFAIRTRDRVDLLYKTAATICRHASYGLLISPEPKPTGLCSLPQV